MNPQHFSVSSGVNSLLPFKNRNIPLSDHPIQRSGRSKCKNWHSCYYQLFHPSQAAGLKGREDPCAGVPELGGTEAQGKDWSKEKTDNVKVGESIGKQKILRVKLRSKDLHNRAKWRWNLVAQLVCILLLLASDCFIAAFQNHLGWPESVTRFFFIL